MVPSLLLFLATHPSVKPEHLSSIKEITCGAAPASKTLIDNFLQKAQKDIRIRQGLMFCCNLEIFNQKLYHIH